MLFRSQLISHRAMRLDQAITVVKTKFAIILFRTVVEHGSPHLHACVFSCLVGCQSRTKGLLETKVQRPYGCVNQVCFHCIICLYQVCTNYNLHLAQIKTPNPAAPSPPGIVLARPPAQTASLFVSQIWNRAFFPLSVNGHR